MPTTFGGHKSIHEEQSSEPDEQIWGSELVEVKK
jgi:hypothetical protein